MSNTVSERRREAEGAEPNGGGAGARRRSPARRVVHLSLDERVAAG
jgi:hypothetical protein